MLYHFQTQLDATNIAVEYLLKKGYSQNVLKPYTTYIDYFNEIINRIWSDFKTSIHDDKTRIDLNWSITWRPVTGIYYQELVSDENFIKRWK